MYPYYEYEKSISSLQSALKATGLPFDGIEIRAPRGNETARFVAASGEAYIVTVNHAATSTQPQRQQLNQIVAAFVFEKRKTKTRPDLRQLVDALSPKDFKDLLIELLVEKLQSDADFAKRLGKTVDGDEPSPPSPQKQNG
jgi:hypothetical protein